MAIIVLGAHGQLGRQLCSVLPGDVRALGRQDVDVTKPSELRTAIQAVGPRIVINAAGYTQVDRAEAEPTEAFAVNALAVRELALICRDVGATLIHFSTNYVFGQDSQRAIPYLETDAPGPLGVYGASKLAGEQFISAICPRHFILRTCGLYGDPASHSARSNFVEVMLRQASGGGTVRVVDDQICSPTSAVELARAIVPLLESRAFGLYHVTNAGACSWFEFAQAIFAVTGQPARLVPIGSADYGGLASRPRYSVLSNSRWVQSGFSPLRDWKEALGEALAARK